MGCPVADGGHFEVAMMDKRDLDQVLRLHLLLFEVKYTRRTILEFFGDDYLALVLVHVDPDQQRRIVGVSTARKEWMGICSVEKEAYLATFGIDEPFRRRGLGTYLMGVTLAILHGASVRDVNLHCLPKESNLKFYGTVGFQCAAQCPRYYTELGGEDAVLMKARAVPACPERLDISLSADVLKALRRPRPSLWERWLGRAP